jgi:hypothetical protein
MFLWLSAANHHSAVAPYPYVTAFQVQIVLTREHIATSLVFTLGASFLTLHLAEEFKSFMTATGKEGVLWPFQHVALSSWEKHRFSDKENIWM